MRPRIRCASGRCDSRPVHSLICGSSRWENRCVHLDWLCSYHHQSNRVPHLCTLHFIRRLAIFVLLNVLVPSSQHPLAAHSSLIDLQSHVSGVQLVDPQSVPLPNRTCPSPLATLTPCFCLSSHLAFALRLTVCLRSLCRLCLQVALSHSLDTNEPQATFSSQDAPSLLSRTPFNTTHVPGLISDLASPDSISG